LVSVSSEPPGLLGFGPPVPVHRFRQVHDEVARHVRLGLKLLDEVFAGLGVDVPVEGLEVVSGGVAAVLGELDREPLERATVKTGQEPLNDELGPQVEPGDLADHFRAEVFFGVGHKPIVCRERRGSEKKQSIIFRSV
jgi:hypothetical protein